MADEGETLPEISVEGAAPPLPPPRPADLDAATKAAAPMAPTIDGGENIATLIINGQRYTNWTSLQVRREYKADSSAFQATLTEPNDIAGGWSSIKIKPGDRAAVYLSGIKVIDGYVIVRTPRFDEHSHQLVIDGKSLVFDITKTSVKIGSGYKNATLEQIVNGLLASRNLPIKFRTKDLPTDAARPFDQFWVEPGETLWNAIERLCRMRGVFLTDDKDGNLVGSTLKGSAPTVGDLIEGVNILACSGSLSDERLTAQLSVIGQHPGSDDVNGKPVAQVGATAKNSTARPWRARDVIMEEPGLAKDAQTRADFELADEIYTSVNVTCVVTGWTRPDGQLWEVTDRINVDSPWTFPENDGRMTLGLRAVTFQQNATAGTTTVLELCLQSALGSLPDPNVKGAVPNLLAPQPGAAQPTE